MRKLFIAFIGFIVSNYSFCQTKSQIKINIISDTTYVIKETEKTSFVPAGTPSVSNAVSSFRLITSSDGTLAALHLGFGLRGRSHLTGNIEVASPLSDGGITRPASLDGLASKGRLTFGIKYKGWRAMSSEDIKKILQPYKVNSFMDLNEEQKSIVLDSFSIPKPWFLGITGTINKQSFGYAMDNTLLDIKDEDKYSFVGSAFVGVYIGKSFNSLLRGVYLYTNKFTSNKANEYFIPFNSGPTLIKRNIIIGAPNKTHEHQVQADFVTRFSQNSNVGINPSITYLINNNSFVFDIPIYLIPQLKEEKILDINGGVYLTLATNNTSPFAAGLFIGSSLSKLLGIQ